MVSLSSTFILTMEYSRAIKKRASFISSQFKQRVVSFAMRVGCFFELKKHIYTFHRIMTSNIFYVFHFIWLPLIFSAFFSLLFSFPFAISHKLFLFFRFFFLSIVVVGITHLYEIMLNLNDYKCDTRIGIIVISITSTSKHD